MIRRFFTKDKLEPVDTALNIGWKLTLAVGTLVLLLYCAAEGVMPDGTSAGGVLLLVFAVLGFGFVLTVGSAYGALSMLWALRILIAGGNRLLIKRGKPTASMRPALMSPGLATAISPICFAVFASGAGLAWFHGNSRAIGIVSFFMITGFLLLCFFGTNSPKESRIQWRLVFTGIGSALFVALSAVNPHLLDVTMGMLGIRALPNDAVIVAKTDRDNLVAWTKLHGITLRSCAIDGTDQWVIQNGIAVWHGLGSTSYVRIQEGPESLDKSVLVPVPSNGLTVLRQRNAGYRCPSSGERQTATS